MPFFIVASDCNTGKPVYKELNTCDANELTWMRASASMPLASRVVKVDGYELLDGGITDSIPLQYFSIAWLQQKSGSVNTTSRLL